MMRLRPLCQWTALLVLLVLPMLSRGSALYEAFGAGARNVTALAGSWGHFLYRAFSSLFGGFDEPALVAAQFQGSYWSITLFGITFNDPLAALGYMAARGAVHWPLIAGTLAALVLAALAGRAFCGWICPVNTILELNDRLRGWIERRVTRVRLAAWMPGLSPRVYILVAGLVISAVAGVNVFILILPYAALARDWHLAVYGAGVGFGVFFMVVLLATELIAAPRLWCRSLCPTGLVLGWLGRWRTVRVARTAEGDCLAGCHLCLTTCRFGVTPRDEIDTDQCVMCNACVTQCPTRVLEIAARPPRRMARPGLAAKLALVLMLAALPAADALAHHIKGMPHYGYIENYPQIPTYEKRVVAPPWQVTVVAYLMDGLNRKRSDTPDDAMIYVSLANQATGKPYRGRLEVEFRPVGAGSRPTRSFKAPLEESVYRMRVPLTAGAYDVVVRTPEPGGVTAKVRLSLKEGTNWWLIASLAVAAVAAAALARAVLRRRRRSATMAQSKKEAGR